MKNLLLLIFFAITLCACGKNSSGYTAVKPRYHRSWTPNHVNKKKWHIGRMKLNFEKQGVKTVKMK